MNKYDEALSDEEPSIDGWTATFVVSSELYDDAADVVKDRWCVTKIEDGTRVWETLNHCLAGGWRGNGCFETRDTIGLKE